MFTGELKWYMKSISGNLGSFRITEGYKRTDSTQTGQEMLLARLTEIGDSKKDSNLERSR